MLTVEKFIAGVERDVQVIKAMLQALEAMSLVDQGAVEVESTSWRLNFSREIGSLKEALNFMGQRMY